MRRPIRVLGLAAALGLLLSALLFGHQPVVRADGPQPTPTTHQPPPDGEGGGGHTGG